MTKADIVEIFYVETGIPKKECAEMVDSVLEIIKRTLESGETVKISGFGSFSVKSKADRKGRNPQTGESMTITARRVLSFKCSSVLRQVVNQKIN